MSIRLILFHIVFLILLSQITDSRASSQEFRFVVISDTHLQKTNGKYSLYPATDRIIESILRIKPDFVIHCGDMISINSKHNNEKEIDEMWNIFNVNVTKRLMDAGIPFFPSMGNHDAYGLGRVFYKSVWKNFNNESIILDSGSYSGYYSFHYDDSLFISIDGSCLSLSEDNRKWLFEILNKNNGKYKNVFIISHVGLIGKGRHISETLQGNLLFSERGVNYFISGHQHTVNVERKGSLTHFISGSAGETYPYEYLLFTINGKKVTWKILSASQ